MDKYELKDIELLRANKVREDHRTEYKAAKAIDHTKEITRDVSSFANASGGIIIYGLTEIDDPVEGAIPGEIDPIPLKKFTQESLEQVINRIEPRIPNVRIFPVMISAEGFIYVVVIPQGETAHQAVDLRYYRRYNFQRLGMHDQEIRDVMGRSKNPKVIVTFSIGEGVLRPRLYNEGAVKAKDVRYKIEIPAKLLRDGIRGRETMQ